ncbi:uncharacterized protein BCR38DRAFT_433560 [Pseudomassariella vexata]|uniref:Uncharacterized protein n=1 Tax=Pseudomassariella vexata TaxID=1141098 RepID=A0A1Y2DXD9_9PEZI|nr:uncharacterized protein BCR38DRAFT_433560 [Pseudomassariella vexata]ORY63952.1 hypothetical protein BCR38DRAFT_433560 [Pseudomassariella vexata]
MAALGRFSLHCIHIPNRCIPNRCCSSFPSLQQKRKKWKRNPGIQSSTSMGS